MGRLFVSANPAGHDAKSLGMRCAIGRSDRWRRSRRFASTTSSAQISVPWAGWEQPFLSQRRRTIVPVRARHDAGRVSTNRLPLRGRVPFCPASCSNVSVCDVGVVGGHVRGPADPGRAAGHHSRAPFQASSGPGICAQSESWDYRRCHAAMGAKQGRIAGSWPTGLRQHCTVRKQLVLFAQTPIKRAMNRYCPRHFPSH